MGYERGQGNMAGDLQLGVQGKAHVAKGYHKMSASSGARHLFRFSFEQSAGLDV
jgi:hypothetical protein